MFNLAGQAFEMIGFETVVIGSDTFGDTPILMCDDGSRIALVQRPGSPNPTVGTIYGVDMMALTEKE